MPQANKMEMNLTGIAMSPDQAKDMVDGAEKLTKASKINQAAMNKLRADYSSADSRIGSVPVPASFKGLFNSGKEKIKGHNPAVLLNKLGQRLAFERAGVRIYDALIFKFQTIKDPLSQKVIPLYTLERFRDEELEHFLLLKESIESLGADPTAITPDADVSAIAAMGIPKVLMEPRTTVLQCLEAVQTAELTDNAAWEVLIDLCSHIGMTELADAFLKPLEQEQNHVEKISGWIDELVLMESGSV